ncbi:hypothetical protein V8D89_001633 [Ganoderma adspersum]
MQLALSTAVVTLAALVGTVVGETHTVHFENDCGFGTPMLIQGNNVLSNGKDFVSDGALVSAIAYLQNGDCGFNGENCTLLQTTLLNFVPGENSGSLTDISLIPPHEFSVPTGFHYFGVCDGLGSNCDSAEDCSETAVSCQEDNVNLAITFCDSA